MNTKGWVENNRFKIHDGMEEDDAVNLKQVDARVSVQSTGPIDGTSVGASNFPAIADNRNFVPIYYVIRAQTVDGLVGLPTMGIGDNAPMYNNITAAALLTGINAADQAFVGVVKAGSQIVQGGNQMFINITTAAIATTFEIVVDVVGYLIANE